jgi:putative ABC transport system permease protein
MSPTSYQAAPPRDRLLLNDGQQPVQNSNYSSGTKVRQGNAPTPRLLASKTAERSRRARLLRKPSAMDAFRNDIRQAARALVRTKATSFAAFLMLALGLGIAAALVAVVDGVVLRPLPYPDSEQLVLVSEQHPGATSPLGPRLSNLTLDAWDHSRTLDGLGAYGPAAFLWRTREGARRLEGGRLSPVVFRLLRVAPARGRFFLDSEEQEGRDGVVVLSHALWLEQFGGQDNAIGSRMHLDDRDYEIVGVAPAGFAFPSSEARLWTPQTRLAPGSGTNAMVRAFQAIGRLRPGITRERAASEATAAARSVIRPTGANLLFGKGGPVEVRVASALEEAIAGVKPALLALTVGVILVLLVACANVANLLLTTGVARQRELAVRSALGASRAQLVRLMLIESLLLSGAGLAAGLVLSLFVVDALPVLAPADFPRLEGVAINLRVVGVSALAALVATSLAGLLPAWRGSRTRLSLTIKDDDGRSAGHASARLRSGLLVAEAALALVLLVGAALLIRSVDRLRHVDTGYDPANVLTAAIEVTGASAEPARRVALVDAVLRRLRGVPGVTAAGAGNMAPFGDAVYLSAFSLPFPDASGQAVVAQAASSVVTPGFAEALGLHLLEGRTFTASDPTTGGPIVVSETFARRYLHDGRPIAGRAFPIQLREAKPASTIVGVVEDVRPRGPRSEPRAEIYLLAGDERPIRGTINIAVRTVGDPLRVVAPLRDILRSEDPSAAVTEAGTLAAHLSMSVAGPRFFATVLGVFAALALTLAAIGLYSVLSYTVTLRRRELGIRAALGASRRDLLSLVVRQGLAATAAGLAVGLVLAFVAARLMRTLLFGIEPADVPSFAAGSAVLLAVALVACLIPARRAAASDPRASFSHE